MDLYGRKLVDMAIALVVGALFCDQARCNDAKKAVARRWLAAKMPEVRMNKEQDPLRRPIGHQRLRHPRRPRAGGGSNRTWGLAPKRRAVSRFGPCLRFRLFPLRPEVAGAIVEAAFPNRKDRPGHAKLPAPYPGVQHCLARHRHRVLPAAHARQRGRKQGSHLHVAGPAGAGRRHEGRGRGDLADQAGLGSSSCSRRTSTAARRVRWRPPRSRSSSRTPRPWAARPRASRWPCCLPARRTGRGWTS